MLMRLSCSCSCACLAHAHALALALAFTARFSQKIGRKKPQPSGGFSRYICAVRVSVAGGRSNCPRSSDLTLAAGSISGGIHLNPQRRSRPGPGSRLGNSECVTLYECCCAKGQGALRHLRQTDLNGWLQSAEWCGYA